MNMRIMFPDKLSKMVAHLLTWYDRKALLAKPNPNATYFYLMLGDLTKIAGCVTSLSKIAGKN